MGFILLCTLEDTEDQSPISTLKKYNVYIIPCKLKILIIRATLN